MHIKNSKINNKEINIYTDSLVSIREITKRKYTIILQKNSKEAETILRRQILENIDNMYREIENKIVLKHCFSHTEIESEIN